MVQASSALAFDSSASYATTAAATLVLALSATLFVLLHLGVHPSLVINLVESILEIKLERLVVEGELGPFFPHPFYDLILGREIAFDNLELLLHGRELSLEGFGVGMHLGDPLVLRLRD